MQLTKELFVVMILFTIIWIFFNLRRESWRLISNKFETFSNRNIITVSCILLFIIEGVMIFYRTIPFVADEVYSLSGAAFFAGYNWSTYMSLHKFYNFGYTMLLAPIYHMFKNPISIYRGMLFVNTIVHIIVFCLAYDICNKKLNMSKLTSLGISLVATCNSIIVFFKGFVYNELPLIFIVWMIVWLLLTIDRSEGIKSGILSAVLGIIVAYAYIIHSRCLIIFVSLGITALLCLLIKRNFIARPVWFAVAFAVSLYLEKLLLAYVQANLYLQGKDIDMNNSVEKIATNTSKFKLFFSAEGLKKTIFHFFSLSGAMTIETGGILTIATVAVIYYVIKYRKQMLKGEMAIEELIIGFFSTISFWGMVLCIAVTGVQNGRFRFLAYTRYFSPFIGPFLLLGLFILKNKTELKWKITAFYSVLITAIVCLVYIFYSMPLLNGESLSNNASLYFFYVFVRYAKQGKFSKSLFAIALGLLIIFTMVLLYLYKRKQFIAMCSVAMIFSALLFWNVDRIKCVKSAAKRVKLVDSTYELFQNDDEIRDKKIYCAGNGYYTKSILVTLYDTEIEYKFPEDIGDNNSVILSNDVLRLENYSPDIILKLDGNEYIGLWNKDYADKLMDEFPDFLQVQ